MLQPSQLSPDVNLLVMERDSKTRQFKNLAINPDKGMAKWFWQRALGNNNTFTQTIPANGQVVVNISAPPEENLRGDFEICYLLSTSTGRFTTQIFQSTINRNFQNTPIPNNLLYGKSTFPGFPAETMYLQTTTNLQLTLTDISGASNQVSIVAVGRRFLDWGNERMGDVRRQDFYSRRTHPYWLLDNRGAQYSITTGGGTATLILNVPQDADFNAIGIVDDSDGDFTMQIFEGLSSRALSDAQISCQNFCAAKTVAPLLMTAAGMSGLGGGRFCGWSHLFKRSSQINIQITDTSNVPNNIRLALFGELVYYQAPGGGSLTLEDNYAARYDQPGLWQKAPLDAYGASQGPSNPMGNVPQGQGLPQPGFRQPDGGMGYLDARIFDPRRGR